MATCLVSGSQEMLTPSPFAIQATGRQRRPFLISGAVPIVICCVPLTVIMSLPMTSWTRLLPLPSVMVTFWLFWSYVMSESGIPHGIGNIPYREHCSPILDVWRDIHRLRLAIRIVFAPFLIWVRVVSSSCNYKVVAFLFLPQGQT